MEWLLILTINAYNYGAAIEVITTSSKAECVAIGTLWENQNVDKRNSTNLSYVCARKAK